MLASRRKPELIESTTFSLVNYNEAERIVQEWNDLRERADDLKAKLDPAIAIAYYELVSAPIALMANHNELYVAGKYCSPCNSFAHQTAGRSNNYATQSKQSASRFAERALTCFKKDQELTDEFHDILDGKWN